MRNCYISFIFVFNLIGASAFAPGLRQQTGQTLGRQHSTSPEPSSPSTSTVTASSRRVRLLDSSVPQTETDPSLSLGSASASVQVDYDALLKYHAAIAIQLAIIAGIFKGLDTMVELTGISDSIPTLALVPLFYALSLKSRVFNPLNNERPNLQKALQNGAPSKGFRDRIMPSWTPPGPVFPIMWLLIIGPLRAYSSALVWQSNGHEFCHPALLALVFHLAVGDVWNTMNNAEQRPGAAVTGVLCVTATAVNAAYQYHTVDPLAGQLLGGLPMIWFAIATSLVTATWRLNPPMHGGATTATTNDSGSQPSQGLLDPLYPIVRDGRPTTFAWFETSAK